MYLARTIDEILESRKEHLLGSPTYKQIASVLTKAFKSAGEPFKFRHETYDDYSLVDYSVSGLYDMDTDIKYIILNFSSTSNRFNLKPRMWRDFKFAVSQVCQHETIHQCQWQHRHDYEFEKAPLHFRSIDETLEEEQMYLADSDEIDAYGHDIAMEIRHFYPKQNPYDVLKTINRKKKVWSYQYYKRTFDGEQWSEIKNRLLKKAYMWLPHTSV